MRYEQQAKFKEIGDKGQKALEGKTAAVVGLGNLGSTISVMLLRSGVNLRLVDKGRVELTELSGQSMYLEEDHSKFKAKQAKKYMEIINPRAKVKTFHEDLNKNNLYLIDADVIIDATGNLETSRLIAEEAKKKKKALIYTIVSGSQGIVASTDKGLNVDKLKPTLAKMKPINEAGVISPAIHLVASIAVSRALKVLLNKKYEKDALAVDVWDESVKKQKL